MDVTVASAGQPAQVQFLPTNADSFVAEMRTYLNDVVTVHHGHMPEITLTSPDTANGIWAMEDIVE